MRTRTLSLSSHGSKIMLPSLVRYLIFSFLVFIPFQRIIKFYLKLPNEFNWSDEIFVIIIVIFGFVKIKTICRTGVLFLIFLSFFGVMAMISGLVNGNPFLVTVLGVGDYAKYFLVIPFIGLFINKREYLDLLLRTLHILTLIFCIVAIIQFFCHLAGVPLSILGEGMYSLRRFGILRVSSLLTHPNIFGFYTLLFFTIDIHVHRRLRWQNVLFSLGIVLSTSRMVWAAFVAILILFFLANSSRWKRFQPAIVVGIMTFLVFSYNVFVSMGWVYAFRVYSYFKSLSILKDNLVWGVGPGMYGGIISLLFHSPVYEKYNFSLFWFQELQAYRSIDQFWMQSLVELGIMGTSIFLVLLFFMGYLPWKASRSIQDDLVFGRLNAAFACMPLFLGVFLLGSGLNLPAFVLTYTVLFGAVMDSGDHRSVFDYKKDA